MKNNIILLIKGFFMGIANVIPGVSGGTIALSLGIYEKFISSISNFLKDIKENIKFLLPIIIGMVLSLLTMSKLIDYSYKNFPIPTTLFFVGLVIGGIPFLLSHVKGKKNNCNTVNYIIMLLTFSLVMIMTFADKIFGQSILVNLNSMNLFEYIKLFFVGVIAAGTMVIPGISGSLVLMLLGYYYPIITIIKNFTKFNNIFNDLIILGVFAFGMLIGIIVVAKLLEYLFEKHELKTYYGVLGFIFASVIAIFVSSLKGVSFALSTNLIISFVVGIICMLVGIFIAYKLGEK